MTISIFSNSTIAYAHIYSNIRQLRTDRLNNIKIQFCYLPEKPVYNLGGIDNIYDVLSDVIGLKVDI